MRMHASCPAGMHGKRERVSKALLDPSSWMRHAQPATACQLRARDGHVAVPPCTGLQGSARSACCGMCRVRMAALSCLELLECLRAGQDRGRILQAHAAVVLTPRCEV